MIAFSSAIALLLTTISLPIQAQSFAGTGTSGNSTKGGSRGSCPNTGKPLTPLVPISAPNGGWTAAAHPTVWVYMPYTLTSQHSVKFVLQDEQGAEQYQTRWVGTGTAPGILGISLPADKTPPLAIGKVYTWSVMVYCDRLGDVPAVTSATVQRVALDPKLQQQLTTAPLLKRSQLHVANRLWYDSLTTLSTGRLATAADAQLIAAWKSLLQRPDVGLEPFTTEPLQQLDKQPSF
jgi:Domain of Unknown Function (DUF928)